MNDYKIIVFAWNNPEIFKTYNILLTHNQEFMGTKDLAIDIAAYCFKAGVNVMIYEVPNKNIIWVVIDEHKFNTLQGHGSF